MFISYWILVDQYWLTNTDQMFSFVFIMHQWMDCGWSIWGRDYQNINLTLTKQQCWSSNTACTLSTHRECCRALYSAHFASLCHLLLSALAVGVWLTQERTKSAVPPSAARSVTLSCWQLLQPCGQVSRKGALIEGFHLTEQRDGWSFRSKKARVKKRMVHRGGR